MVPVPSVEESGDKKYVEATLTEFPDICKGIGKLRDVQVHLHIDPSVKPVIQPYRRVPFALRAKVEEELERLEKSGVVEKVEEPTTWVSPIVIQQKSSGDIRICVDMGAPNVAIKRVRCVIPTIEEIRHKLNGAVKFTKLYLTKGFHQLELHPDSRYITTFATHIGLVYIDSVA